MTVSIHRAVLRKLAEGWRPKMTVEVKVQVLSALLDEHDRLVAEVERLEELLRQQVAERRT